MLTANIYLKVLLRFRRLASNSEFCSSDSDECQSPATKKQKIDTISKSAELSGNTARCESQQAILNAHNNNDADVTENSLPKELEKDPLKCSKSARDELVLKLSCNAGPDESSKEMTSPCPISPDVRVMFELPENSPISPYPRLPSSLLQAYFLYGAQLNQKLRENDKN